MNMGEYMSNPYRLSKHKYADMGTILIGKVESGECVKGQALAIYPNRTEVKVDQLWSYHL